MKKIVSLILILIMLSIFCGCEDLDFANFADFRINYSSNLSSVTEDTWNTDDSSTPSIWDDCSSNLSSDSYSYYTSSESNAEKDYNYYDTPTFYTLETLRDYLNSQKDKDIFKNSFCYKGSESLEAQMLAQMVSCFYLKYQRDGEDSDLYTIEIIEYPGDRIVDAYFSGNQSSLTADEQKVFDQATQTVALLKSKAKDDWELELFIHDMLADHITYYDTNVDVTDPNNPPRFLTSIGALIDGEANCQGYADAFYVLASMAGFKIGRMNVETDSDLHVVNTILLDGSWYVVDVTFDDQGDDAPTNYRLFNAGLDQINDFYWKPFKEIHKIASVSNNYSYYIRNGNEFNSANDFADYIKEKWSGGENLIRGVIRNQTDSGVIKKPLEEAFNGLGQSYSYKFWCTEDGKDAYYAIKFD